MSDTNDVLSIDVNDLTVGEIETIEDLIDASIDSVGQPGSRKGRFLRAVAYVIKRRDNPEFTWDDAANVRMTLPSDAEGNAEVPVPNRRERRAQSRKRASSGTSED